MLQKISITTNKDVVIIAGITINPCPPSLVARLALASGVGGGVIKRKDMIQKYLKTQKEKVLWFIIENGPVRVHQLNQFGVDNFINHAHRLANKLVEDGLIHKFELNETNTEERVEYIATNQIKEILK